MRSLQTAVNVTIPSNCKFEVNSRNVTVTGPLGVLKRSFTHSSVEILVNNNVITVQMWFAARKQKCAVNSIATHIKNMFRGVQKGYKFRLRFAYAHFPIQANLSKDNKKVEIKNFVGERLTRTINALEGVTITRGDEEKDVLWVQGISLENASQTCSLINQSCKVKNKDIRQFLDGIYVSDKRLGIDESL